METVIYCQRQFDGWGFFYWFLFLAAVKGGIEQGSNISGLLGNSEKTTDIRFPDSKWIAGMCSIAPYGIKKFSEAAEVSHYNSMFLFRSLNFRHVI